MRARIAVTRAWSALEVRSREEALALLAAARHTAEAVAAPDIVALSYVQECAIEVRCANWEQGQRAAAQALATTAELTPAQLCSLQINRGMCHLGTAELDRAREDFESALAAAIAAKSPAQEFKARHNLGCLAFVSGDLPTALAIMRQADEMPVDVARDRARLDHAQVLIEAGLIDRAMSLLREGLAAARADSHRLDEGEHLLDLARCYVLDGDLAQARSLVNAAIGAFRTRQASQRVLYAELVRATIDVATGARLEEVAALTDRLDDPDGPRGASAATILRLAAEARLLLGQPDEAAATLARLPDHQDAHLAQRLHDHFLRASLADARDDAVGADAELIGANALLRRYQRQAQSLEVRASLAFHADRLASFDIGRSLRCGDAAGIFDSVERWRAASHRRRINAAAPDPVIAELARELRRLRTLDDSPRTPSAARAAQIATLEDAIADRALAIANADDSTSAPSATVDQLVGVAKERGRTLVSFGVHQGAAFAVVVGADGAHHRELGPAEVVAEAVTRVTRDQRAAAYAPAGSPIAQTVSRALTSSLAALDRVLLTPIADLLDTQRLVVIPGHALSPVPWLGLPSSAGHTVTVAPSASRWLYAATGLPAAIRVRALAGPKLHRAGSEVAEICALWSPQSPCARSESTSLASAAEVIDALASNDLVHLAAHGRHEEQSPLFSSLRMSDGPVFAHEFPRPIRARHVVLSACDVGRSHLRPGDEPLGMTAALLGLGVEAVVAAVAPIPDAVAGDAMVVYHRGLVAGLDAAAALAAAVDAHPAARAFCLFGADWQPPSAP